MKKLALLAVLFMATPVSAAPFFVVDKDTSPNPPTQYIISSSFLNVTVPALTTGSVGVRIDVANAPVGTSSLKVKGCFSDPIWGQICNTEQTFPLVRPSGPAPISGAALVAL